MSVEPPRRSESLGEGAVAEEPTPDAVEAATRPAQTDGEPAPEPEARAQAPPAEAPPAEAPPAEAPPDGLPPKPEAEEAEEEEAEGEERSPVEAAARRRRFKQIGVPLLVLAVIGGGYYIWTILGRVKIGDSNIQADTTVLAPRGGGKLRAVFASAGDEVQPHRPVAQVGNEMIVSDEPGTVIAIRRDLGTYIPAGKSVATLIRRGELKAIGHLKQNKGLSGIRMGQRALVKIYGYRGAAFPGYVEEISEEPEHAALSFSISEKNERPKYEVKVRITGGPVSVLRQDMDAKIFVYKR